MRDQFTTKDIVALLGVQRGTLRKWVDYGFVSPSNPSTGQGIKALYNINDLYRIALYVKLIEFGLNRQLAADVSGSGGSKSLLIPPLLQHGFDNLLNHGYRYFIYTGYLSDDKSNFTFDTKQHSSGVLKEIPQHFSGNQISIIIIDLALIKNTIDRMLR